MDKKTIGFLAISIVILFIMLYFVGIDQVIDALKMANCYKFVNRLPNKEKTMLRKTTKDGDSTYSSTTKRETASPSERITTSRRITNRDYNELLEQTEDKPIRKYRYCFSYNKQYYKLDLFEEPNGLMILETGLTNENDIVDIPDFIKINRDITDDLEFRNASIYRRINRKTKKSEICMKFPKNCIDKYFL